MPRAKSSKSAEPAAHGLDRADLKGLVLITVGALLLAGLWLPETGGPVLAGAARWLAVGLGQLADVVPFVLFALGAVWVLRGEAPPPPGSRLGVLLLLLAAAGLLHQRVAPGEEFLRTVNGDGFLNPPEWYGGLLGAALCWLLRGALGKVGAMIVLGMMALAGVLLVSERTLRELVLGARERLAKAAEQRRQQPRHKPAQRPRPQRKTTAPRAEELMPDLAGLPVPMYLSGSQDESVDVEPPAGESFLPPILDLVPQPQPEPSEAEAEHAPEKEPAPGPTAWRPSEKLKRAAIPIPEDSDPKQMVLPGMPVTERSEAELAWFADGEPTKYKTPPLDLVQPEKAKPLPDRTPEILANSQRLETTLGSFKIEARVVNTEIGPTVTRYELELAPGIRVNRVANLADDIALALASDGIRIEAPVPGKGVIGIEVPNQIREIVNLHDILTSKEFRGSPGPLPFVVGKDIAGDVRIGELTRMPHMLVAGSTNSGKSVCLNCLIISLLYRLSPRDLRFLMIDPKRVELTLYDGIPHLDRPVVTDPDDASDLLRGAVREMMARYDRLHDLGVRNIASYNQTVDEDERMPYVVIIIDELAELMMLARAEVEASICRLAQLARATGIHLVVATQRPSVNVVTGSIKANIGTRVAFSVAQQVDSRVILDQVGAERLIGRGDMLYAPIDAGKPERIQGSFVDELQVHRLVEYLHAMPSTLQVKYAESIIQPVSAEDAGGGDDHGGITDDDLDDLFWDCVHFIRRESEGSTSRLQRNFGIGYNRAGRIMDQMHELGIVGPPRGSKPREVLPGGPNGPADLGQEQKAKDLFDELTERAGGE